MSYYAVKKGVTPGVYATWDECGAQVLKFPGAVYRKFATLAEAERFAGVSMRVSNRKTGARGRGRVSRKVSTRVEDTSSESGDSSESESDCESAGSGGGEGAGAGVRSFASVRDGLPTTLHIYTDGACSANGTHRAAAGYGVFIAHPEAGAEPNALNSVSLPVPAHMAQTNNVAELLAIIHALRYVRLQALDMRYARVIVHTDSSYAMRCLGDYGARLQAGGWRERRPNLELVREGFELLQPLQGVVYLEHVRAHTAGDDPHSRGNRVADHLAVAGCRGEEAP